MPDVDPEVAAERIRKLIIVGDNRLKQGGPAELVDERCGVLVDPLDVAAIAEGMRAAAALPVPCAACVEVAQAHSRVVQVARIESLLADVVKRR